MCVWHTNIKYYIENMKLISRKMYFNNNDDDETKKRMASKKTLLAGKVCVNGFYCNKKINIPS